MEVEFFSLAMTVALMYLRGLLLGHLYLNYIKDFVHYYIFRLIYCIINNIHQQASKHGWLQTEHF